MAITFSRESSSTRAIQAMQCRRRWYNKLNPLINKEPFTEEDDDKLIQAQSLYGNKWSMIAGLLPGRTDLAVKNRWRSLARRQREQSRAFHGASNPISSSSSIAAPPHCLQQHQHQHHGSSPLPLHHPFAIGEAIATGRYNKATMVTCAYSGGKSDESACTTDLTLSLRSGSDAVVPCFYHHKQSYDMAPQPQAMTQALACSAPSSSSALQQQKPSAFSAPSSSSARRQQQDGDKLCLPFFDFLGVGER